MPGTIPSNWSHDIRFIEDEYVENVVIEYQETKEPDTLQKIMNNFSIFKNTWARDFAPFLDDGLEEGKYLYDEIVWKSARQFNRELCHKGMGKAFNAYFTSALMNTLKNLKNYAVTRGPRIKCQVCGEEVCMIDSTHLKHVVTVERYSRVYPRYPISSWDGKTICPLTKERVDRITEKHLNDRKGLRLLCEWEKDNPGSTGPYRCPVTGTEMKEVDSSYPEVLAPGYSEAEFIQDFPDFEGIVECSICKKKMLGMSQEHLDSHGKERITLESLEDTYPNLTEEARQVKVLNPYTGDWVDEITLDMLRKAGTTVREHLERHATVILDKYSKDSFFCPFTGQKRKKLKATTLARLGHTPYEFYLATCRYPLRRFQVRCAICGEWVDNIGEHLEEVAHHYAEPVDLNDYEMAYGRTKNIVMSRLFVENEDGERTSLADLTVSPVGNGGIDCTQKLLDMKAAFDKAARDDLDRRIVEAIRHANRIEDVIENSVEKKTVILSKPYSGQPQRSMVKEAKKILGVASLELDGSPTLGSRNVNVVVPGRETICLRLRQMASRVWD